MAESAAISHRRVAVIDESGCIGCALCIKACPVDAIIGAPTFLHAVIGSECIGCELCIPPCPTDCIEMIAAPISARKQARMARERRSRRQARLATRAQRETDSIALQREALKKIIGKKAVPGSPDKLRFGRFPK